MGVTSPPVFSDTVDQSFFIESQGGPQNPISYLDAFPDTVYNKSIDSVLVSLLYGLLGPAGVGKLRQEYLEARLQIEDANIGTSDLDALYTDPFAFARLAEETYDIDANADLLSSDQRVQVLASDAQFRNRAIDFFKGVHAGGTVLGLSLVAKSALNHPVDIVENYRALYDQYSDMPLHLPFMGTTNGLNEVIVLPRQDVPRNALQSIVINGEPASGWFTLTFPMGPNYLSIPVGVTGSSTIITVPDASKVPQGVYVSIATTAGGTPVVYAQAGPALSATTIQLESYNGSLSTGSYWAYIGIGQTIPVPYNANAITVQLALGALPIVGGNNILVNGGPLPDLPVSVTFVNGLGDQPVPTLLVNTAPDLIPGIGGPSASSPLVSQMVDATNNPLSISGTVTTDISGVSTDTQSGLIPPQDEHAMHVALDLIRPVTSLITTAPGTSTTVRQPTSQIFAASSYTEVLRYEVGNPHVQWPQVDPVHWIERGVEHEAPRAVGDLQHLYQGFHNISNVVAYTEAALNDAHYGDQVLTTPLYVTYWDTHVGTYSKTQRLLYPFLAGYSNTNQQFNAMYAVAPSPDPLVFTNSTSTTTLINDVYPTDYLGLPGVLPLPTKGYFWSSLERAPDSGGDPSIDYLEIDLGTPQAVNYIYFEATNKPYKITVSYDVLGQAPTNATAPRSFIPITVESTTTAPSTLSLSYNASVTNPWSVVEIHCNNALGTLIFTRYLRIGFQRNPGHTPFAPISQAGIPYSIEVRNLRVGRNLAS